MIAYLSLGANIGNREQTLLQAVEALNQQVGPVLQRSDFYYSRPWGFDSEHDFCNLCLAIQTDLSPYELLSATQAIERQLGRTHKTTLRQGQPVYSDRTIDIDIIRAFDSNGSEIIINQKSKIKNPKSQITNHKSQISEASASLTLPHPLWQERDFVKIPLESILAKN